MGNQQNSGVAASDASLSFDDFEIIRNIGKGSFSKVCIVQKRNSKTLYAMKYVDKQLCLAKDALRNVMREVDILCELNHPFLVNLWFSFQDSEDIFIVFDLLLGGDLRFHLNQKGSFPQEQSMQYLCELALALDYLKRQHVVHRDVKPENILLDEKGHARLTDFNIATTLDDGALATSLTGTRPYMAPEIFGTAFGQNLGYSYAVDWWSLGISVYEMLTRNRPFDIRGDTNPKEARDLQRKTRIGLPGSLELPLMNALVGLLQFDADKRISSIQQLQSDRVLGNTVDFQALLRKKIQPIFVPKADTLHCDPSYELEEMIIEDNPLYKKRKRSATRQQSKTALVESSQSDMLERLSQEFKVYNREAVLRDEEARVVRLEEELGLRPQQDAIFKRLGVSYDDSATLQQPVSIVRRLSAKLEHMPKLKLGGSSSPDDT